MKIQDLNPVQSHNNLVNLIYKVNKSEMPFYAKIPAQSSLNALAVITGVAAGVFETAKSALSIPTALLIKYPLGAIKLISGNQSETFNKAYKALPGLKVCAKTAIRAVRQFVGIVPSLTGVLVVGSEWNVKEQFRLGNAKEQVPSLTVKEKLASAERNISDLKLNVGIFKEVIEGLKRINTPLKLDLYKAQEELDKLTKELSESRKQNYTLAQQLSQAKANEPIENKNLKAQLIQAQKELEKLTKDLSDLRKQNDNLAEELSQAKANELENKNLKAQLDQAQEELDKLTKELSELRKPNDNLAQELSQAKAQLDQTQKELKKTLELNNELNANLNQTQKDLENQIGLRVQKEEEVRKLVEQQKTRPGFFQNILGTSQKDSSESPNKVSNQIHNLSLPTWGESHHSPRKTSEKQKRAAKNKL